MKKIQLRNLSYPSSGKKGNIIFDGILVLVFLFIFSIILIISINFSGDVVGDLTADTEILSNSSSEGLVELNDNYALFWDNIFIFVLSLLIGLVVVASLFIDVNPLFFIFGIILLIVIFIAGGYLSNAYEELSDDGSLGDWSDIMPKTYFIMTHLIETLISITAIILIALYGKSRV